MGVSSQHNQHYYWSFHSRHLICVCARLLPFLSLFLFLFAVSGFFFSFRRRLLLLLLLQMQTGSCGHCSTPILSLSVECTRSDWTPRAVMIIISFVFNRCLLFFKRFFHLWFVCVYRTIIRIIDLSLHLFNWPLWTGFHIPECMGREDLFVWHLTVCKLFSPTIKICSDTWMMFGWRWITFNNRWKLILITQRYERCPYAIKVMIIF